MGTTICPLCGNAKNIFFHKDKNRTYSVCDQCKLIFVTPDQYLSIDEERSRNDLHQNSIHDIGHCDFLRQMILPLNLNLKNHSKGLDFGSGKVPVLALLMREMGHDVSVYDPHHHRNEKVFNKRYAFITMTEVMEHLHTPLQELIRLYECLKPGGWMGVMTALVVDPKKFGRWYYKNDLTHICFYSESTFNWIARYFRMKIHTINKNVVLMSRD